MIYIVDIYHWYFLANPARHAIKGGNYIANVKILFTLKIDADRVVKAASV